jgi:two-component system chemotaxis response regulator CheB
VSRGRKHGHDVIVIGTSAGGVQTLVELCRGLPGDLPAAVFVAMHVSPLSSGVLPQLLDRAGALVAKHASDGETWKKSHIYIAPPDHHMLIDGDVIRLSCGPKENGFRPAVDPLFRTAAATCGARVIGVVLSGGLDDGTQGLLYIKNHGGVAVVQDPKDAVFPSMPASAMEAVDVDHVAPIGHMAKLLKRIVREPLPNGDHFMRRRKSASSDPAAGGDRALKEHTLTGPPSPLTCPDCGGALWELKEGEKVMRYRCHVGHNYSDQGLAANKADQLETALWTALRTLEEHAELRRRMAGRATASNLEAIAERYEEAADDAERRADVIREVLMGERKHNGDSSPLRSVKHAKRGKTRKAAIKRG